MNALLGPYVPMLVAPLELLEEHDDETSPGAETDAADRGYVVSHPSLRSLES